MALGTSVHPHTKAHYLTHITEEAGAGGEVLGWLMAEGRCCFALGKSDVALTHANLAQSKDL